MHDPVRTENIRDVMAFPKTASAQDLMMDSPGIVDDAQLDELGIECRRTNIRRSGRRAS
jgi:aspartyl-tRNA synthetase